MTEHSSGSPTNYEISIPDNPTDVQMSPGDTLTIKFTQTIFLWNSDPREFDPPLTIGIYYEGQAPVTVTAVSRKENVTYGFVPDAVPPGHRGEGDVTSGGHTIQVGSGSLHEPELEKVLRSEPGLCECWPCAAKLINLLLTRPLPVPVEAFLKVLLEAGNAVCTQGAAAPQPRK